jgi:chromate transport protein ChrA
LSLAAAGVTAVILLWAILRNGDESKAWMAWIISIAMPVIVLSIAASFQYGRGHGSGAGAAAAAVYWVLLIVLFVAAAPLYFFGALLQSTAWFISRPRPTASQVQSEVEDHAAP